MEATTARESPALEGSTDAQRESVGVCFLSRSLRFTGMEKDGKKVMPHRDARTLGAITQHNLIETSLLFLYMYSFISILIFSAVDSAEMTICF
jgi:hypothetical protein